MSASINVPISEAHTDGPLVAAFAYILPVCVCVCVAERTLKFKVRQQP